MRENEVAELLLPADISEILEEYGDLFQSYSNLPHKNSVFSNYKKTTKRLEVLFPFKEHRIHGITGFHAVENYDEAGYVRLYQYNWKIIIPKMGVQFSNISGWGNDPHQAEWTPKEFRIKTEPHHHHYDPKDRKKRRENYNVRTLRQALDFIRPYLETGREYIP